MFQYEVHALVIPAAGYVHILEILTDNELHWPPQSDSPWPGSGAQVRTDSGMEATLRNLLGPFPPSMTQGFDVAVHVVIFHNGCRVGIACSVQVGSVSTAS